MKPDDLQLMLRPHAVKVMAMSIATAKRREKHDPEFPQPIVLSATRIAYKVIDVARYQAVLAKRPRMRPAVADEARESAQIGVAKRAEEKRKQAAKSRAAKRKADRQGAASAANGSRQAADVPPAVPRTVPAPAALDSRNPSRGDGSRFAEGARHEVEKQQR